MPEINASNAFVREKCRERKPKANSPELQPWDPQPTLWGNVRHQSKCHFCNETVLLPNHSLK